MPPVLTVMATCGMYDHAGSWLYEVGMPAKSGVCGGILAVLPGRFGIGVYSPEFFAGCEPGKFPLLPLLKRAIAARRLRGQVYRGDWCDIGTPERLATLEARLEALNTRVAGAS